MRTDFIFENARFIGLFANRPAYCDSILTRLLSAFVGKLSLPDFAIGRVESCFEAVGKCRQRDFPRRPRSGRVHARREQKHAGGPVAMRGDGNKKPGWER
jgi:hypothetical protein